MVVYTLEDLLCILIATGVFLFARGHAHILFGKVMALNLTIFNREGFFVGGHLMVRA